VPRRNDGALKLKGTSVTPREDDSEKEWDISCGGDLFINFTHTYVNKNEEYAY
jgi:hypothetical protein